MQKILGYVRKACEKYNMLADGDTVAVCVSGGKDSLILLRALAEYRRFSPQRFGIKALTVDMRYGGNDSDFSYVSEMCRSIGIEYRILPTDIGQIVFDVRKEPNPCSLCAKMRRGALLNEAENMGCNKIALGHNKDDVIETFLMCLFNEGRVGCFSPVTGYPDRGMSLIRPLVLAPEKDIFSACRQNGITPVKSLCPADKHTARQDMKQRIAGRERSDRGFKERIFGALCRSGADGWHE